MLEHFNTSWSWEIPFHSNEKGIVEDQSLELVMRPVSSNFRDSLTQLQEDIWGSSDVLPVDFSENINTRMSPEELQEHIERYINELDVEILTDEEFLRELIALCGRRSIYIEDMLFMMYSESYLDPQAQNSQSWAVGLIQFMPSTLTRLARSLGHGTVTPENMKNMSGKQQLEYVEAFYAGFWERNLDSLEKLHLATFYPVALWKPKDFVLGSESSDPRRSLIIAEQNPAIADAAGRQDGLIDVGGFYRYVQGKVAETGLNIR